MTCFTNVENCTASLPDYYSIGEALQQCDGTCSKAILREGLLHGASKQILPMLGVLKLEG